MTTTGHGLTVRDLAQLRVMLEQQQGFRLEQLAALTRPGVPGLLGSADDEISASLAAAARAALHDVRAALQRMSDGRYGLCTACATPLRRERLEILPQVAMCMPCQRDEACVTSHDPGRGGSRVAGRGTGVALADG